MQTVNKNHDGSQTAMEHNHAQPQQQVQQRKVMEQINKVVAWFKEQLERRNQFTFLLVGRTGVGKSSTINSLLGEEVAPVGDFDPTTFEVKLYECEHGGVKFHLYDTPGLCDELPKAGKDSEYIEKMTKTVKNIDCLWYVTPLDDSRIRLDEKRAWTLITRAFGPQVWQRSVIVFTRADMVPQERFEEFVRERSKRIWQYLAEELHVPKAYEIPAVAVANGHANLPNGKPWLGELFVVTAERCSAAGVVPFVLALRDDITPPKYRKKSSRPATAPSEQVPVAVNSESLPAPASEVVYHPPAQPQPASPDVRIVVDAEQKERVKSRVVEVVPQAVAAGAGLGAAAGFLGGGIFGVLAGAALGAIGGAIVGFLSWLFDW